ncbi:N-acetylmuramoyl-L-alanine amidase [Enterococcus faecium]
MTLFYSGIAGRRGKNPSGVVIHNDAGSQNANSSFYRNWLPTHNAENGFAHYYVASDGTFQAEKEENMAWHTATANGNANFIGIEACQSMGSEPTFRANEQKAIQLAAQVLKRYGLPVNRNTVILHKQFVPTSCPHRSVSLHGDMTVMQDYFIAQINKCLAPQSHDEIIAASAPKTVRNYVGKLEVFNELSLGIFRIAGWLVPITGAPYLNHGYVFWKEAGTGVEVGRCSSRGIERNDVNKAYGLPNGLKFGLDGTLDIKKFAGKKVYPCLRRTNEKNGNSIADKANGDGWIDIEFPEYVLTIPKR